MRPVIRYWRVSPALAAGVDDSGTVVMITASAAPFAGQITVSNVELLRRALAAAREFATVAFTHPYPLDRSAAWTALLETYEGFGRLRDEEASAITARFLYDFRSQEICADMMRFALTWTDPGAKAEMW